VTASIDPAIEFHQILNTPCHIQVLVREADTQSGTRVPEKGFVFPPCSTTGEHTMSNQPVCTLRDGRIKVSVWQNDGNGNNKKPFYSATVTKSYQDGDGKWQETHSLTGNEMVRASELLNRAYSRYHQMVELPKDMK
jgi:hypothetical protein